MARVNIYLPDKLATAAREAGLNVSALTQRAITDTLARQATDDWLAGLGAGESDVTSADVLRALDEARAELGG
jgi:post-segregation antitoxin (ccd killing protein)